MQVSMNNSNNPNFGLLYIHKGLPIGKTYRINSDILNFSKEYIKGIRDNDGVALIDKMDVHIRFRNLFRKGFDITVGKVVDSPIKRLFGFYGETTTRTVRAEDYAPQYIPEELNQQVLDACTDYYKFRDYLNSDKYKGPSEENPVFEVVIDGQTYYKRYNNSES